MAVTSPPGGPRPVAAGGQASTVAPPGASTAGGPGPVAAGGQASTVAPPGASTAPGYPLQAFYENPEVPLSSGPDRARRQARMLAEVLRGVAGPAVILDVGCGDGSALAAAKGTIRPTSSPGSTGPPTPCGRPGPVASRWYAVASTRACRSRTVPRTW